MNSKHNVTVKFQVIRWQCRTSSRRWPLHCNQMYQRFMDRGDGSSPKSLRCLENIPKFRITWGTLTFKEKYESETKLDEAPESKQIFSESTARISDQPASLPEICGKHSSTSAKDKNVTQDWFIHPYLRCLSGRSWRRCLRQVNGSPLEKTQRRQSENPWGPHRPHDNAPSTKGYSMTSAQ